MQKAGFLTTRLISFIDANTVLCSDAAAACGTADKQLLKILAMTMGKQFAFEAPAYSL